MRCNGPTHRLRWNVILPKTTNTGYRINKHAQVQFHLYEICENSQKFAKKSMKIESVLISSGHFDWYKEWDKIINNVEEVRKKLRKKYCPKSLKFLSFLKWLWSMSSYVDLPFNMYCTFHKLCTNYLSYVEHIIMFSTMKIHRWANEILKFQFFLWLI